MTDKAFSVTQFVDIVNLSFEQFESVAVEGEISTSTKASSGHWYFSIKDEEAVLSCAMFRGKLYSVRGVFKVGDKVRVTAKPKESDPSGASYDRNYHQQNGRRTAGRYESSEGACTLR